MEQCDFLVVGAGIAGASVAAHVAATHRVIIIDMEASAGYHTTSRSAASYEPNYGPPPMLAFTRASKAFFDHPPTGFADGALLVPRASLFLEAEGQAAHTATLLANAAALEEITPAAATSMLPALRPAYAKRAFLDRHTADMDVDLIHSGYLRLFKARGGHLLLDAPLTIAERTGEHWQVRCGTHSIVTPVIINAAGAWADVVATRCGARPLGVQPKRRSIAVVPMPADKPFQHWPMVTDVGETWYAKPQSGKLIVSSADATAVDPHDAWADDMAIAEGIDRLMQATTLEVTHIDHSWAGLRTFALDGNPVVGFDPHTDGFFWLAGQGGYGIQSCPALSETAAALARRTPLPAHVLDHGLVTAHIAPERFST
jgi:D-arginine dehydrogenase